MAFFVLSCNMPDMIQKMIHIKVCCINPVSHAMFQANCSKFTKLQWPVWCMVYYMIYIMQLRKDNGQAQEDDLRRHKHKYSDPQGCCYGDIVYIVSIALCMQGVPQIFKMSFFKEMQYIWRVYVESFQLGLQAGAWTKLGNMTI